MKRFDIDDLFRLYYRPLCLYAARFVRDADAVEDLVQAAFVALWERVQGGGRSPDSPKAYLYRMVHNRCIDATQGRKTKAVLVMSDDYIVLSALVPDTIARRFGTEIAVS